MRAAMILAVLACVGAVANGELFFEDQPSAAVQQQRSLLATTTAPGYYGGNVKATGIINLLIEAPAGKTLDAKKEGLKYFNARIKRDFLRPYNKRYPGAHLNMRVTYISGATVLIGKAQRWVKYSLTVDLGPPGASYSAGLRARIRVALKKRSKYVKKIRGNIPRA